MCLLWNCDQSGSLDGSSPPTCLILFRATTGPWARAVLRPFTNKLGPAWKKLERGIQAKIDKLPPGVSSFLDMKTSETLTCGFQRSCETHSRVRVVPAVVLQPESP